VEYSLVVALIALAAVASMKNVAVLINAAYTRLGTKLSGYVS
jgi:Flp pilus assembly pilin Flp